MNFILIEKVADILSLNRRKLCCSYVLHISLSACVCMSVSVSRKEVGKNTYIFNKTEKNTRDGN